MARHEAGARRCSAWRAERIYVELFNGSESMMPGVVGAARPRAPHLPEHDDEHRRAGLVRAKRHRRALEPGSLPEPAGAGRGVRRPGPLVLPDRCLSQLRELVSCPGAVVYDPEPLDMPADGNLLVCCSQPTRDVVIDL